MWKWIYIQNQSWPIYFLHQFSLLLHPHSSSLYSSCSLSTSLTPVRANYFECKVSCEALSLEAVDFNIVSKNMKWYANLTKGFRSQPRLLCDPIAKKVTSDATAIAIAKHQNLMPRLLLLLLTVLLYICITYIIDMQILISVGKSARQWLLDRDRTV